MSKEIPMSDGITQSKSLAFAGIIIFIYNLIWIIRFEFKLNIFTEESYVMMIVGLILIYPLYKENLVDKNSENDSSLMDFLSQIRLPEIIIFGSLFTLILYIYVIN